jgi:hypothetical protein
MNKRVATNTRSLAALLFEKQRISLCAIEILTKNCIRIIKGRCYANRKADNYKFMVGHC